MLWMSWLAVAGASDVLSEEPHTELLVGFHAGQRSYGHAPFQIVDDQRALGGLDEPFAAYPLNDAVVMGPRAEGRVVVPPLRVTGGWQRAYPDWEQAVPDTSELDGKGNAVQSSVRGLRTDEVVMGIGMEAPTGLVVPWLDLVGIVHVSRLALEVDGRSVDYHDESFSLAGRAGIRWQVGDHVFVEASGEYSPIGIRSWGAGVGLGVACY